eukprot:CAMPEP_0115088666 /NCGR_PEP_ID=MMETSP0227-20121206/24149_1 /TAXON_ID=89957 /ORGANISM="Polarella glacialis, Strain CCMP 1383" /LENGTH=301 /DNA_ID=CAMNT_0002479023 /DNA_START=50 /DNA_END=956 /DNA_ORIENTATION=+
MAAAPPGKPPVQVRESKQKEGGGRRHTPYNSYIQRERQKKYYEHKKTNARYGRLRRYEEKQQEGQEEAPLLQRMLSEGADAVDAEYERRLELSFGGSAADAGGKLVRSKKRSKKGSKGEEAAPVEQVGHQPADGSAVVRSRKRRRGEGDEEEVAAEPLPGKKGKLKKKSKEEQGKAADKAAVASPSATRAPEGSDKQKGGQKKEAAVPIRFKKELREFQAGQDAKEAERNRRDEEEKQRNRKRKDSARDRAVMGQRLAQRNSWGQPSMQSRMEIMAEKLGMELGKGKGKGPAPPTGGGAER